MVKIRMGMKVTQRVLFGGKAEVFDLFRGIPFIISGRRLKLQVRSIGTIDPFLIAVSANRKMTSAALCCNADTSHSVVEHFHTVIRESTPLTNGKAAFTRFFCVLLA